MTENSPGPQTVRRAVNGGFLSREARRLSSPPLADTAFYQKQLAPHWAAQSMFPSAVGKQLTTTSCYTHTTPGSTATDGRPRPRDHPTTSLQEPGKAFTLGLLFYITPPPPVQQSASHYCLHLLFSWRFHATYNKCIQPRRNRTRTKIIKTV